MVCSMGMRICTEETWSNVCLICHCKDLNCFSNSGRMSHYYLFEWGPTGDSASYELYVHVFLYDTCEISVRPYPFPIAVITSTPKHWGLLAEAHVCLTQFYSSSHNKWTLYIHIFLECWQHFDMWFTLFLRNFSEVVGFKSLRHLFTFIVNSLYFALASWSWFPSFAIKNAHTHAQTRSVSCCF